MGPVTPTGPGTGISEYSPSKFFQPSLPPTAVPAQSSFIDEEDCGWWVGIQKCGATLALAGALLASSFSATQAQAVARQPQDELPQTVVSFQPDEDCWQIPVAPVAATLSQLYLPDPEEIPAAQLQGVDEEYYWQNPAAPLPNARWSLYLPDAEEIPAAQLQGVDEEYYWQNPVAPVPATIAGLQQWPFDEQTPALSSPPLFQPDEDFWANPVLPVQASLAWPTPWQDEQSPALFGQPDEDFWLNPVAPIFGWRTPQAFAFDELIVPQPSPFQPDEDLWAIPTQQALAWPTPRAFTDDDVAPQQALSAVPDEAYWLNPAAPVAASNLIALPVAPDPELIPAASLRGQFDEDFWTVPEPWALISPTAVFAEDSLIVPQAILPFAVDEGQWPVPASASWLPAVEAFSDDQIYASIAVGSGPFVGWDGTLRTFPQIAGQWRTLQGLSASQIADYPQLVGTARTYSQLIASARSYPGMIANVIRVIARA